MSPSPVPLESSVAAAADAVRAHWATRPLAGLILGSGLGELAHHLDVEVTLPYADMPYFPRSTAVGHRGQLVCGRLMNVPLVAMQGRFHIYEGYSPQEVTLPVRVMSALGTQVLIVSNASGGLNPNFRSGDLMVIDDHINLMFRNPLIGRRDRDPALRFPDMSAPYDRELIEVALSAARQHDFIAHRGVYAGLTGPTYETRAEYRFLRRIGADVVGMSTVPEVIVAIQERLRVLGISVVTNVCRPDALTPTTGEDVVRLAAAASARMELLVRDVLLAISHGDP